MREFDTGATRDNDTGKLDYEAYLSPVVLRRFAEYMNRHQEQADGTYRPGDNWQKGIPLEEYMKSLLRHTMELWELHRTAERGGLDFVEVACAILFNIQGYLFEYEKAYG